MTLYRAKPHPVEVFHHKHPFDSSAAPAWARGLAFNAGRHEVFIVQFAHRVDVYQPCDFHRDFERVLPGPDYNRGPEPWTGLHRSFSRITAGCDSFSEDAPGNDEAS